MTTSTSEKKSFVDDTKIGDCSAQQPLSGVGTVMQSGAVNGLSNGGFLRMTNTKSSETRAD